jgi:NAD(P)-dependent dehydrogenase (short-subunit alcohol dehydrogenase family)
VNALTLYVAAQYGRQGVRCNAISPGLIVTPAVQNAMPEAIKQLARHVIMPRNGKPADIANLACFLASDEASFITGQVISVDGGYRAKNARFADTMDRLAKK